MAYINVNRENTDQFYRYKMPTLLAKVEGKGNGIKTVVVNMVEIGKALNRPPSYPCKYFGCELGAQTQMDPKNARFIVNGAHESSKLQDMLDGFIRKFVLCPECDNPETDLNVNTSKGKIGQSCKACGYHGMIDPRQKLTTFIIKNPPTSGEETPSKKDKKARRLEKQEKQRVGKGKNGREPVVSTSSSPPATEQQVEGEDDFEEPPPNGTNANETDDWSVDTSQEAVKARMENLSNQASALALHDDLEKTSGERVNLFYKFVEDIKKKGGVPAIAGTVQKVRAEAERLEVMDKAAGILAELLYTEKLLTQIKEYRSIMLHFVLDNRKGQKYLLGAFEILVGEVHPELLSRVPHILKAFYDNDILEEEAILEWADRVSKKHVKKEISQQIHEKAMPFVEWLRTAEEETSEEEEEDEVEVVYSEKQAGPSITAQPQETSDQQEDDIDIDAI